ncbi:NUDIX domain-containing protein [Halostella litorea]|uniref:NUDIX domain-containing protein n=1 Tax=Halostella litorea TaxID=2528831 RepID=UPI0010932780|nr:NUDIX domain-containing protein [Halostella litorea]
MSDHTHDSSEVIESVTDPETLAERSDVAVEEETDSLPPSGLDHWRGKAGLVGVGVTSESGELLLWDGVHGWTLPYVEVAEGEDFAARAREAVETLTGVTPTIVGVERATRVTYQQADGDDSATVHQFVFRASPVDAETASEMAEGEDAAVKWVTELDEAAIRAEDPDDIEAEAADIRLFLD